MVQVTSTELPCSKLSVADGSVIVLMVQSGTGMIHHPTVMVQVTRRISLDCILKSGTL